MVTDTAWAVADATWDVTSSMWAIAVSVWAVSDAMCSTTASAHAAYSVQALCRLLCPLGGLFHFLCMLKRYHVGFLWLSIGCCILHDSCRSLHACCTCSMWAISSSMWNVEACTWVVTREERERRQCVLWQLSCLCKCSAHISLANHSGVRTSKIRPLLEPTCNNHLKRMQGVKTGKEDREPRQGTKGSNEDSEPSQGKKTGNQDGNQIRELKREQKRETKVGKNSGNEGRE